MCHLQEALITDISPWAIFPDLCPVYVGLYIALPTHLTQCLPSLVFFGIYWLEATLDFSNGICKLNVPLQKGTTVSRDGAMRAVPFFGLVRQ